MKYKIEIDTESKRIGIERGNSMIELHPLDLAWIIDEWALSNWKGVEKACEEHFNKTMI